MVRKKLNSTLSFGSIAVATATLISLFVTPEASFAIDGATLTVNAGEVLTVQIDIPNSNNTTNTGDMTSGGTFLYNRVTLSVSTNNTTGYTATLSAATATTALTNRTDSTYTIPTLGQDSTACSSSSYTYTNFPSNCWGFSTVDPTDNSQSYTNRTYYAVPASTGTPAHVVNSSAIDSAKSTDIYFGAKANSNKMSGTYTNNVIINVVSGVDTDNPSNPDVKPDDPVTPSDDNPSDNSGTYVPAPAGDSTSGATVYTNKSTENNTRTTTTTIKKGDTTYANPAGVTTVGAVNEGTPLATGLAVTAGVAATAGVIFFIVAKRRRDDEEEEDDFE